MKQNFSSFAVFGCWVWKKLKRPFENLKRSIRKRLMRSLSIPVPVPTVDLTSHQSARRLVLQAVETTKAIEPMLQQFSEERIFNIHAYSVNHSRSASGCALKQGILSLDHHYAHIIFVPWLCYGGADLVAIHALRAAQERHGVNRVLLVVTDSDRVPAKQWLPSGTHLRILSDFKSDLSQEERISFVKNLIHSLQPKAVLNVNSQACWNVFKFYGTPLSHSTNLYAMLFCYDYDPDGRLGGYAIEFFRDCLPSLTRIYSDNASFWNELSKRFGVPSHYSTKFVTLYQPAQKPPGLPIGQDISNQSPKDDKFRVFWAGRICRQKNPLLLLQIARLRPDFNFDVYGLFEDKFESILKDNLPPNVHLKGPYSTFEAIPVASYNAFLYTSLWDGLPNVLIQAGRLNIAVVASGLDSIVELIDETTGWPIKAIDSPEGYAKALDQISQDPVGAAKKAANLCSRIAERHSWKKYTEAFSQSPSFIE